MLEILLLLLLLVTMNMALANPFGSNLRRRDSVVDLHIVKRPILPFNITFLQPREDYNIGIENRIGDSVENFLFEELEETYRTFYTLELDDLPSTAEEEWPYVRINVSFAGNFIFVLSGEIPEDTELHCLEQELLLDTYRSEFEDIFEFNETGDLELDFIKLDQNIFCPPPSQEEVDEHGFETDEYGDDDGNIAGPAEKSSIHPKGESIDVKEFLVSREFMFLVLGMVALPLLVCLFCVCRKTRKVRRTQESDSSKSMRDSGASCSTRKTAASSQFLGPGSNGSESSSL